MDTSTIMWGLLFGSIGVGFFVYGKKQKAMTPLFCGVGLMIAPYFTSNVYILVLSGIVLIAFSNVRLGSCMCERTVEKVKKSNYLLDK